MDYSKINLYFLRIYAREIGVKSPSSCKKDVLIKKIKQVEAGAVKPFFTKLGRPSNEKTLNNSKIQEVEPINQDKSIALFIIDKFRKFLDELEEQIEDNF